MEVEATGDGTVKHLVATGTTLEPGAVVGYIFAAGEEVPAELSAPSEAPAQQPARASSAPPEPRQRAQEAGGSVPREGGRIFSSPRARRVASELDVDIAAIAGSGPGGRIVEADVKNAAAAIAASTPRRSASPVARRMAADSGVDLSRVQPSSSAGRIRKADVAAAGPGPSGEVQIIPVRGMRKTIARRMYESLQTTAQLTMNMEAVMDDAVRMRAQLIQEWEAEGVRPSYTDLAMRAAAKALRAHPRMNAEFMDTEIRVMPDVNVGLAVALEEGLIVPVVHQTDVLSLKEIAMESSRLAAAARDGKLGVDEVSGGTFTVSTLGMFGVDSFTPILNPPQVGILGVNRLYDAVAWEGERPVKQKRMQLSLTWDHRALDGEPAAQFLRSVVELLEAPFRLLV